MKFTAPAKELQTRLSAYESSGDPMPIYDWVSEYHGEGPSEEMRLRFYVWGLEHVEEMNTLLADWPEASREYIFGWIDYQSSGRAVFVIPELPSEVSGTKSSAKWTVATELTPAVLPSLS